MASNWQKATCDRCGFVYKKKTMLKKRGLLLCADCCDDTPIKPVYPNWGAPRTDSTSVSAVFEPIVFVVGTAGILALAQSATNDDVSSSYTMKIEGDGAVELATIVTMPLGTELTLEGRSDTNTVAVTEDDNVQLTEGEYILKAGKVLSLVSTGTGWRETSRGEVYF